MIRDNGLNCVGVNWEFKKYGAAYVEKMIEERLIQQESDGSSSRPQHLILRKGIGQKLYETETATLHALNIKYCRQRFSCLLLSKIIA